MSVQVTLGGASSIAAEVPDFPMLRVDGERMVYQEALIDGRYLGAHLSAMGRPKDRRLIWSDLHGGDASARPLRTRQHAFTLEVDGQLLADRWTWVGSRDIPDGAVVTLRHERRPVEVEIHTTCDGSAFFTRHLVITNIGEQPAALARVMPWSGLVWNVGAKASLWPEILWHLDDVELPTLGRSPFSVGRMTSSTWATEGAFDWVPIPSGHSGFESMRGRSGFGAPMCFVRNDATGETLVVDFAWSGNWSIAFFNDYEQARRPHCDARAYVEVGLAGPAPLRVLEPGESAVTPTVHLGALFGDLDAAVQGLHRHIRANVVPAQPAGAEHLVELSTWTAAPGQVIEEWLYREIDLAAELGVELFLLDAGWFGSADLTYVDSVGDWDQESPLLTQGLRAALARVRERGMRAALWMEPERIGPASRLYRDHPEWLMRRHGEVVVSANKGSSNLDLSQPEVAAHFERTIVDLVERYDLDCFRLDYNHNIGEGGDCERGGYVENVMWRHYEAFYGVFDRLRERFPHLLLSNCSSGGGRMDLGVLSRFHWTQITDRWSPGPTARILNGTTIMLPPELCETFLAGGYSQGVADIDFLIRVGLFGRFTVSGPFPSLEDRNASTWERWRHGIELYKSFCRPILPTARMFHHTPIQRQGELGEWIVLECADAAGERGYAGVFRLPGASESGYLLRPRGLRPDRRYAVTYDSAGWTREIDGGVLLDSGLQVPVSAALTSELLLFTALTP